MKKRYIVLLDQATKEQDDQFLSFIKEHRLAWWHWLTNSWLILDSRGVLSSAEIRDAVMRFYPGVDSLVIELKPSGDTWSGFGPKSEQRNMFRWIHDNWKKA